MVKWSVALQLLLKLVAEKTNLLSNHFHHKLVLAMAGMLGAQTIIRLLLEQSAEKGIIKSFARYQQTSYHSGHR